MTEKSWLVKLGRLRQAAASAPGPDDAHGIRTEEARALHREAVDFGDPPIVDAANVRCEFRAAVQVAEITANGRPANSGTPSWMCSIQSPA